MVGERRRLRRRRGVGRGRSRVVVAVVLCAVVVVVVVGAIVRIGPASGPDRRTVNRSYVALVAPIVAHSNSTGASLNHLLDQGPSLDRVAFFSALTSIAADTEGDARRLAAVPPPSPTAGVAESCGAAMDDRARVGTQLRSALGKLLGGVSGRGGGDEAAASRALVDAGKTLQEADASWAACRAALRHAPGSARLPVSRWVPDPGAWQDAAVGPLVASLAGSPSLLAVDRIALVLFTTTPASVPDGTGVSVLPATSTVRVEVVVANQGNIDERGVTVVVTAVPQSPAPAPHSVRATADIPAGTSAAVTPEPLRVRPGTSYLLQVTATSPPTGAAATGSLPLRVSVTPTTTTTTTTSPSTVSPTTGPRPLTTTTQVRSG